VGQADAVGDGVGEGGGIGMDRCGSCPLLIREGTEADDWAHHRCLLSGRLRGIGAVPSCDDLDRDRVIEDCWRYIVTTRQEAKP